MAAQKESNAMKYLSAAITIIILIVGASIAWGVLKTDVDHNTKALDSATLEHRIIWKSVNDNVSDLKVSEEKTETIKKDVSEMKQSIKKIEYQQSEILTILKFIKRNHN